VLRPMKKIGYQKRFYRRWANAPDLFQLRVAVKETDVQVSTDRFVSADFLAATIQRYRSQIERYIAKDERFLTSLSPVSVERGAPAIVRQMGRAAALADVGPMAAVAGALAQFLGQVLLRAGCRQVIIENGGDIFLKTTADRRVAVYSGPCRTRPPALRLRIRAQDTPAGICTSSGTVGHSLSFGSADSVVIIARNASLADAVATATGNRIRGRKDIPVAVESARAVRGVHGVAVVFKNTIAAWGRITLEA